MEKGPQKFRPNIPEELTKRQLDILKEAERRIKNDKASGEIEHDAEYFLIKTKLNTGQEITTHIPKNTGNIILDKKGENSATIEEAIEAVQRFYPELPEPDLKEAVRRLREEKSKK